MMTQESLLVIRRVDPVSVCSVYHPSSILLQNVFHLDIEVLRIPAACPKIIIGRQGKLLEAVSGKG
jgi:hypothetical protein